MINLCAFAIFCSSPTEVTAQQKSITVASTTSTEQSGLFNYILPIFTHESGIFVHVIALGTGQALDVGRRGDADVVFVHDKAAEEKFVSDRAGVRRFPVMFNDFVLVGPSSDPANVNGMTDVAKALRSIAEAKLAFISRGDRSGTHTAEMRLWKEAGLDPLPARGTWYREVGQGMGPALNTAAAQEAYVLTDRATWLAFRNRQNLRILVQGDSKLFNQYGVILVNPNRHPKINAELGQEFIEWLISRNGQQTIAEYRINGEQLFFPNADSEKD